jgi:hypothetical protein
LYQVTTLQLAEKLIFSEGYGLQAVRKSFAMNPALAAEGVISSPSDFFRKLFSRAVEARQLRALAPEGEVLRLSKLSENLWFLNGTGLSPCVRK